MAYIDYLIRRQSVLKDTIQSYGEYNKQIYDDASHNLELTRQIETLQKPVTRAPSNEESLIPKSLL